MFAVILQFFVWKQVDAIVLTFTLCFGQWYAYRLQSRTEQQHINNNDDDDVVK